MAQQSDAYPAFTSAWNTGTVPANTTGTALTGLTTAQKLTNINAWQHTGSIPTSTFASGSQIANCIVWSEFTAITATAPDTVAQKQLRLLTLLNSPGQLLGGSANTTHLLVGMLLDCFSPASGTIANLTALALGLQQPWWQFINALRPFDMGDVTACGLS